jgi:hypothetical protein
MVDGVSMDLNKFSTEETDIDSHLHTDEEQMWVIDTEQVERFRKDNSCGSGSEVENFGWGTTEELNASSECSAKKRLWNGFEGACRI